MSIVDKKIGQALVKEKFLTEEQLLAAYDHQLVNKTSFKQAIIDLKLMTEDRVNEAIIGCSGFPFIRLQDYQIEQDAISKIPESKCRQYNLVPISLVNNLLTLAISDPFDLVALDDIALISKCEIIPMMSDEKEIISIIEHYYSKERTIQDILPDQSTPSISMENLSKNILTGDEIYISTEPVSQGKVTEIDETPVIVLVNQIISSAIRKRASDIHIEPRAKIIGLRYRIDGVLIEQDTLPRSIQSTLISRVKIMAKMDIAERRLP
ncbi:MAG: ATPase, T2SS/T4P/T4SS family, partial [Planctomycetota bacterium]